MFYKLTINFKLLQNDEILPKTIENGILFYELVIKNGGDAILRIPFKNEEKWKLEMYDNNTEINANRAPLSMLPHVVRFDNENDLTFHAVKVFHDVDDDDGPLIKRIGYQTHIKEGTSDIQDIAFFTMNLKLTPTSVPIYMEDFKIFHNVDVFKPVVELPLHDRSFQSQFWLTQREFYSTSHVTLSNSVHRDNIQLIHSFFEKYKKYTFNNLMELLIRFAKVLTNGRIKYKIDKKFAQFAVTSDAGDISIETTTRGDCEDFGHWYMRVFRTLSSIYKYFTDYKESDMFRKCKEFEENYIPFNFICQVKLKRGLEFHSTLMIIPITIKYPTISFEVTNPKKSYVLPNKEYLVWHNESYFLVDNYFISRVNNVPLDKVTIHDLKFINY